MFTSRLQLVNQHGWAVNGLLTSISHHHFLDWPILRPLLGGVGAAGEKTRPPYGQQAEAALGRNVPQHPKRQGKKVSYIHEIYMDL